MVWTLPILFAAVSHAVWNLLVKQSTQKQLFLWWMRVVAVLMFLPLAFTARIHGGLSEQGLWLFGGGSVLLHGLYGVILSKAYENNDFSTAYPIARGTGPLFAAIAGWLLFSEPISWADSMGVVLIVFGLYIIHLPNLQLRALLLPIAAAKQTAWPILVGLSVASYTIFDKLAVQWIPPVLLNVLDNIGQVVLLTPGIWNKGRTKLLTAWREERFTIVAAGLLSAVSYTVILISLQTIPISQTAPIRESSIVVGTILGAVVMKEGYGVTRLAGSILIMAGVASIAIG